MEALGYLAFSAVLYLTLRFFRTVFRDYIFNRELYLPDETADSPVPAQDSHICFEAPRERAC